MEETDSTSLFAVFALSILSLVLIPWTIYKLCCSTSDATSKPWEVAGRRRSPILRRLLGAFTVGNFTLLFLWLLWFAMLFYIQQSAKDMTPFDPFAILGVDTSASDSDIKAAYRALTRKYHPDKNSDPEAPALFVQVSKAYKALTDKVSRENWEKYGHPDGPQGIDISIALPSWFIDLVKDEKVAPMLLLVLVACFILLPLAVMGCFLFRSNQFTGPNNIMQETLEYYALSKYSVKESQSIVRIPETLVVAKEFITLHTPTEHQPACEELRRLVLRYHPELKEKSQFWKRRASVIKAHMLLLAHLEREKDDIPSMLHNDLKYVQERTPPLLEEIVKIACLPRRPYGYGWLTPTVGAIQLVQCVTQAVSISARKHQSSNRRDHSDGYGALLQLPGMASDVARQLHKKKVRTLNDLVEMDEKDRVQVLHGLGFSNTTIEDIDTALLAMPQVTVTAECVVDGEKEIMEGDVVTCRVHMVLTRRSHSHGDISESDLRGAGVQAFAPYYPYKRPEKWYIMLTYPQWNAVVTWTHAVLKEAEIIGLHYGDPVDRENGKQNGQGFEDEEHQLGQVVELKFAAPREGVYEFQLQCMSDCWIGCDKAIPLKLSVKKLSRRLQGKTEDEDDRDSREVQPEAPSNVVESDDDDSDDDNDDDGGDDYEYDSEETGEMETDDELEDPEDDSREDGDKKND